MKYSLFDLMRSRWAFIYMAFFLVSGFTLLYLSSDLSKVIVSLMNMILFLCPLIATMFGIMYHYNSREFTELLLAQPIPRVSIFWGQYLGIAVSLSLSVIFGLGIPFLCYGILRDAEIWNFLILISNGVFLSFIFSGLAFLIALSYDNKIKGFGLAILCWLFFAVLYDGILLIAILSFREYPLENFVLSSSLLNPIDLSRIMILLKLDISAIMGYSGAVFKNFYGQAWGVTIAFCTLIGWVLIPMWAIRWKALKKNF